MLVCGANALAVAPNLSITNVATVHFTVAGADQSAASNVVIVTDPNAGNSPPNDIGLTPLTVPAGTPGAIVGPVTVSDPDVGDTHSIVVDDPRFEVVGTTLKLRAGNSLPLGAQVTVALTATDPAGASFTKSFVITAVPPGSGSGTAAQIRVYGYAPTAPDAAPVQVPAAQCADASGTSYGPMPAPLAVDGTALSVPGELSLRISSANRIGSAFFVEVIDPDANLDNAVLDAVTVDLTGANGDVERVKLTETTASSGTFVGYVNTTAGGAPNDCAVAATSGSNVRIDYVDPTNSADAVSANVRTLASTRATIDLLRDGSRSAAPELVDVAPTQCLVGSAYTPAPAPTGANGVMPVPGTIDLVDTTTIPSGDPIFVRVRDPDQDVDATLADIVTVDIATDGGEHESVRLTETGASTGVFTGWIDSNAVARVNDDCELGLSGGENVDFAYHDPVDATDAVTGRVTAGAAATPDQLFVTKTVGKDTVAIGDFVEYQVTVQNPSGAPVTGVVVNDRLPSGFRYVAHSARLGEARLADPTTDKDGRLSHFTVGALAAGASAVVTYVAEVGPATKLGRAENRATATSSEIAASNVAAATVIVREELFANQATLIGEVTEGPCGTHGEGVPGVRVLLDDGTFVVTDADGRYHIEGLRPGTHVVQLDLASLQGAFDVIECAASTRGAGQSFSRFVDVAAASLWREDFHVARKAATESRASPLPQDDTTVVEMGANGHIEARPGIAIPPLPDGAVPAFGAAWLAKQDGKPEIVWPPVDANPRIPAVAVVVKHAPGATPEVLVNGRAVDPLCYEATDSDAARSIAVSRFRNVPLVEGDNVVEARMQGATAPFARRIVHFSGAPVRAEWVPERSYLVADGLTPPVLAVRLFDHDGHPVRPGITGDVEVSEPYRLKIPRVLGQALPRDIGAGNQYLVRGDGIAYLELEATPTAGRLTARFKFQEFGTEEIKVRVRPAARDWVLVGFGEGTVGKNQLSEHMEALNEADKKDGWNVDGKTSFYAKGRIRGEWVATIAYDSVNEPHDRLGQQIDPNKFYMLYGDGAAQNYDASSQEKLYLRLEREDFYALFGDFKTGFDETELTKYDRGLNGIETGYVGQRVRAEAFAANTDQAYLKDQLQGDGTSGIYRLSSGNVVVGSEQITIEIRDRFQTQNVLETRTLTRYLDYSIDYERGTFFTKEPVPSRDDGFNPVFIVVEYEVKGQSGRSVVSGARAVLDFGRTDREIGVTTVHDEAPGAGGDLVGVDAHYQLTEGTKLHLETAGSDTDKNQRAGGYIAEVIEQTQTTSGRVYAREQQQGFGLGQAPLTESGTRKVGIEGEYRFTDTLRLRTEVFEQTALETHTDRDVAQALVEHREGDQMLAGGVRAVRETAADGGALDTDQVVVQTAQPIGDGRLVLKGEADADLAGQSDNTDYPDRIIGGAEYRLADHVSLLGNQEFTFGNNRDTQNTRIGVKTTPWTGAQAATLLGSSHGENGDRLFATTGLLQTWHVNDRWRLDFGMDRVQTLRHNGEATDPGGLTYNPNPDVPLTSGSVDDDFSAYYAGYQYRDGPWDSTARVEFHEGTTMDKWNTLAGVSRQLAEGKAVAASFATLLEHDSDGAERNQGDLRFGLAWRPLDSAWSFLNRLDLTFDETTGGTLEAQTRKLIENFAANVATGRHQVSLALGAKYVVDDLTYDNYDGVTALAGAEYRFDVTEHWDLGARASAERSFESDVTRYSLGASVGNNPFKNCWVSVGYNVTGYDDRDFAGADYAAQGPYLKIRFKVDQAALRDYLDYASIADDGGERGAAKN